MPYKLFQTREELPEALWLSQLFLTLYFARRKFIQRQSLPVRSHPASLDSRAWLNSQNFLNPNPPSLRGQHNKAQAIGEE